MRAAFVGHSIRQQLSANRRLALAAALAFCLVAVLAWAGTLGVRTVARWGSFVGQNVHVIAYLAGDGDPDLAQGLSAILRRLPDVAEVRVVEPAEALARLRSLSASLGGEDKVLDNLEPDALPRSIEVRLVPRADLPERAEALARRLRGVPGVDQVDAMTSGLARLTGWLKLARRLGWLLLGAGALISVVLLVALFLRSQGALRARATVLVHLGQTTRGVRLPAALWMSSCALLGGAAGALAIRLGWRPLLGSVERGLGIAPAAPVPVLGGNEILVGLAAAFVLGLGLGYFATPLPKVADRA